MSVELWFASGMQTHNFGHHVHVPPLCKQTIVEKQACCKARQLTAFSRHGHSCCLFWCCPQKHVRSQPVQEGYCVFASCCVPLLGHRAMWIKPFRCMKFVVIGRNKRNLCRPSFSINMVCRNFFRGKNSTKWRPCLDLSMVQNFGRHKN